MSAFANGNPRNFHDGHDAYRWLGEKIVHIDASNPNLAARLAKTLIVWRRHDAPRGLAMRGTLEWIRGHELSPDTGEVVDKGLA